MKKFNTHTRWLLLIITAVLFSACSNTASPDLELAGTYAAQTKTALFSETEAPKDNPTGTSEPTQTLTPSITPTPQAVGPINFPEDVNPLTGLVVPDPAILDRRPVFVKVANYPAVGRPHAGLSSADMVFEYFIGVGTNRFIAMYYGQESGKIGPVRSGRLVDPHIVSLYEGILGMEGAYITVLEHITEILGDRVISGRGTCPAICDDGRYIVTSVFADSEAMTEVSTEQGVENRRYTLEGMAFDPEPPAGGVDGDEASILFAPYNRGDWRFDADSGKYLRWIEDDTGNPENMVPLVDRNTDNQLAFSNVVILFAKHTELAPTLHEIDLWNVTGQRAIIFRDGQAFDGTWTTPSQTQPIQFLDESGNFLPLKPGNTWVVIMGTGSLVVEDNGQWTFDFRLP